jgi:uncharacterized protein involved in exopolysaccharide biosynthesis
MFRDWLLGFVGVCLDRPRVALLPAAACSLLAVSAALWLPPRYLASAELQAQWAPEESDALRRIGVDVEARGLQAASQWVRTPAVLEPILREEGAEPGDGTRRLEQIEGLAAAVSVRAGPEGIVLIRCQQGDPGRAARVANRLASELAAATQAEHARRAQADPARLEQGLAEAKEAVEAATLALALRRAAPDPEGSGATARVRAGPSPGERVAGERATVTAALQAARARTEALRRAIAAAAPSASQSAKEPSELDRLRAERVELLRRYTELHPDVVALTERLAALESTVRPAPPAAPDPASLRAELTQAEAELAALERREAEIAEGHRAPGSSAAVAPPRATDVSTRDLGLLTRDLERAQSVYLDLQEQWREADAAWRTLPGAGPRYRLVREAGVPRKAHWPDPLALGAAGLALGLGLGLSFAVAAEARDPTVRGPEDLEDLLPAPLLAQIPPVAAGPFLRRG